MQNDNRGKILDQESVRCLRFEVVVQQEKDGAARPRGRVAWAGAAATQARALSKPRGGSLGAQRGQARGGGTD